MSNQRLTHAIVCRIPASIKSKCDQIDVEEAKRQHEKFVSTLRELELDVIEMPADESLPECAFVEDTAVVCNGIALMAKPHDSLRQKEVEIMKAVIKKELDIPIIEADDSNAKLEGGDVLFTGREFFVGLSKWTNEAGAQAVASTFPEYPCVPIKVTGDKHLKYYVSVAGPELLCVSKSKDSQEVLKRIEREASFAYQTITLSEEEASNILYINGSLVSRSEEEIPVSDQILKEKIDIPRKSLNISELGKLSTGITSCCILLRRSRYFRGV